MVAPSQSHGSGASSIGSRRIDSARKRREFPRNLDSRRHKTNGALISSSSNGSASKSRTSDKSSTRPPQYPSSKLNNVSNAKSQSAAGHCGGLVQVGSTQRARSSSPLNSGRASLNAQSRGKPPIAPGVRTVLSNNSPMSAKSSTVGSMVGRSGTSIASSARSKSSNRSHTSKCSSSEQRQDCAFSSRQTFYVRVCLDHLTGMKIDAIKRRRNKSNNIVVGYAALAKSGRRLALSQPLVPTSGDGSSKPLKLFWTNPREGDDSSPSKSSKRKLQFCLKLEKEVDRDYREEDSVGSNADFSPAVVKIVVGLKCGEEKFPLGIVNLVINGKESRDQIVDLALRPMNEVSAEELTEYQQKARVSFFGKKLRAISFKNHDQQYRLASNATLRVRMDVRPGERGTIWGDDDDDDTSYITHLTFDTRGTGTSPLGFSPATERLSLAAAHGDSFASNQLGFQNPENTDSSNNHNTDNWNPSKTSSEEKIPLKYVVVDQKLQRDTLSVASSLTTPALDLCSWLCLPLCGGDFESAFRQRDDTNIVDSLSFEVELPSWNDTFEDPNPSEQDESLHFRNFDDMPAHREERSEISVHSSENDEDNGVQKPGIRHYIPPNAQSDSDEGDMSVEMYNDLKDAEATLLRYAKKIGVDMSDLLDEEE